MKKKMYLVSREVLATDIRHAMRAKGTIYSIVLAAPIEQPEDTNSKKIIGFTTKKLK